jgi:hypothetical protein
MNHQVTSLTATFKNVDAFGIANAADFPPAPRRPWILEHLVPWQRDF